MAKYETHITCNIKDAVIVEREGALAEFKFSKIDGDALMASKPYCYLTAYSASANELFDRVDDMEMILQYHGVDVLRKKIERIIYDTKTGVDELVCECAPVQ